MKINSQLPVVGYGSTILRQKCREAENNEHTAEVVNGLRRTLFSLDTAAGLAAPQVNYDISVFVLKLHDEYTVCINPTITKRRLPTKSKEGCMSIPVIREDVIGRDDIIDVEYYDEKFNKVRRKLRGFAAILFQHEYDHLQGILFIDRIEPLSLERIKDKLADIEKGASPVYYPMIWPDTNIQTPATP